MDVHHSISNHQDESSLEEPSSKKMRMTIAQQHQEEPNEGEEQNQSYGATNDPYTGHTTSSSLTPSMDGGEYGELQDAGLEAEEQVTDGMMESDITTTATVTTITNEYPQFTNEVVLRAKSQLEDVRRRLSNVQDEFISNMNNVVQNFLNKLSDNMHERSVKCSNIMSEVEELFEKNNNARQQLNQTRDMTYSLFNSVSDRNMHHHATATNRQE